jgi:hypothetical protein
MKLNLVILSLFVTGTCFADTYAYIGRDGSNEIQYKMVVVSEGQVDEILKNLETIHPDLTFSIVKEGDKGFDDVQAEPKTARDDYKTATTTADKLAVIEKVLNLK